MTMNNYTDIMQALIAISPVPVIFATPRAGTDGNYHWKEKRIVIRSSLSPPKMIHVFLHELSHALTWDPSMTHDIAELVAEGSALQELPRREFLFSDYGKSPQNRRSRVMPL